MMVNNRMTSESLNNKKNRLVMILEFFMNYWSRFSRLERKLSLMVVLSLLLFFSHSLFLFLFCFMFFCLIFLYVF